MNFHGFTGLSELSAAPGWDPRYGATVIRRWRGTPAGVALAAQELRSVGVRYQIEPQGDGGYHVLVATYGADETQPEDQALSDTWSLAGNDLEKELWDHPLIQAELDKITSPDSYHVAARLRRLCDAVVTGEDDSPDPQNNGETLQATVTQIVSACSGLTISSDPFVKYVRSRIAGVEVWSISQWVLRRTTVVSTRSTIKPALVNVGKIFTTDMLRTVELVPPQIRFDLPTGYWLKRTPTFDQSSADKWTAIQEYWHSDRYDDFVYQLAT